MLEGIWNMPGMTALRNKLAEQGERDAEGWPWNNSVKLLEQRVISIFTTS